MPRVTQLSSVRDEVLFFPGGLAPVFYFELSYGLVLPLFKNFKNLFKNFKRKHISSNNFNTVTLLCSLSEAIIQVIREKKTRKLE